MAKDERITFRLTEQQAEKLRRIADRLDTSVAAIVRETLEHYIKRMS